MSIQASPTAPERKGLPRGSATQSADSVPSTQRMDAFGCGMNPLSRITEQITSADPDIKQITFVRRLRSGFWRSESLSISGRRLLANETAGSLLGRDISGWRMQRRPRTLNKASANLDFSAAVEARAQTAGSACPAIVTDIKLNFLAAKREPTVVPSGQAAPGADKTTESSQLWAGRIQERRVIGLLGIRPEGLPLLIRHKADAANCRSTFSVVSVQQACAMHTRHLSFMAAQARGSRPPCRQPPRTLHPSGACIPDLAIFPAAT